MAIKHMLTTLQSKRGFTLIELMIVVVVVAILATIAVPSYRKFIMRGHRSAAQSAMMDIANRQQQFLMANRSYVDSAELTASGYALPTEVSDHYALTVTVGAGAVPTFLVTMTPLGFQADDGVLTLDNVGNKTPTDKWTGH
jgi:type IV pilus assembly protein PilE